jgi:ORF6N domain
LAFQIELEVTYCDFKIANMNSNTALIPIERIQSLIFLIRSEKVMIDSHLAELYGVETSAFNRAVRRNADRFPGDFMFQLKHDEFEFLRCQIGISNVGRGGRRYLPYAFTEQGVAMLSSVLRSKRAVQVNVAIMRAFVSLRRLLATNETLARKFAELERRLEGHDKAIKSLFDAIRELMSPPVKPRREIGFHAIARETAAAKTVSKRKSH